MILYGLEATGDDAAEALRTFFLYLAPDAGASPDEETRSYAREVLLGAAGEQAKIDDTIRSASTNWRLERMSRVDRNVLRVATYELLHGVPRAVAIDEAVELAKRFGTEESGGFVNGVLSHVADLVGGA